MPIQFECPECGEGYNVGDDHAGKKFKCRQCQNIIDVPDLAQPAPGPANEPVVEKKATASSRGRGHARTEAQLSWSDFLGFRRMVTPLIIQILFWLGVLGTALLGSSTFIGLIWFGVKEDKLSYVVIGVILGPLILILGLLSVRIWSELLILSFQIHSTLNEIKSLLERR